MTLPELSLTALLSLLVLLTAVDVVWNCVLALSRGEFSGAYVADYLRTHVLLRVFPIAGLGVLGHGVAVLEVPAIAAVYLAAEASLGVYLVETVASLKAATKSTKPE